MAAFRATHGAEMNQEDMMFHQMALEDRAMNGSLSVSELPNLLNKMSAGEKKKVTEVTPTEKNSFTSIANGRMALFFSHAEPLDKVSAYKWAESVEKFLAPYPKAKEILMTENYSTADFSECKIEWRDFSYNGEGIKKGLYAIEAAFVGYLMERQLLDTLSHIEEIQFRDVWLEIKTMTRSGQYLAFENYFDDTFKYWEDIHEANPQKALEDYLTIMRRRYNNKFVEFMECQGFPLYVMYLKWGKSVFGNTFFKELDAQHTEFIKKKSPIKGIITFVEKIKHSSIWSEGLTETTKKLIHDFAWRRHKRNGEDFPHLPLNKRAGLRDLGNSSAVQKGNSENQGYRNQNYGNQSYGPRNYGNQSYGQQGHSNQNHDTSDAKRETQGPKTSEDPRLHSERRT